MSTPQFTKTQKGKRKACFEGFYYNFDKVSKSDPALNFWKCEEYDKKGKCKARLHINKERVVKRQGEHNHRPDGARQTVLKVVNDIKHDASTSTATPSSIIMHKTLHVPSNIVAMLPEERSLKKSIQTIRNSEIGAPIEPQTLGELVLPARYQCLHDGTHFLLFDSGAGNDRILLFSTEKNIELLAKSECVFSDGTFGSAPNRLFYQLYTVHAAVMGTVVPLIFALLPNKTFATYDRMCLAISHFLPPQACIKSWMLDFERATINAVQKNFPSVEVRGCFFHLQQCIWRHIQRLGLVTAYRERDGKFALSAKSLAALAFVPVPDVYAAFTELLSSSSFDPRMDEVVEYFENTWIGRLSALGSRQDPIFEVQLWNVYERTKNGEYRTNNNVEGWHRRFQSVLQCSNPTIFKCIDAIKMEQKRYEDVIARLNSGESPPPQRKRYKEANVRIERIVNSYNGHDFVTYLHGLSQNF